MFSIKELFKDSANRGYLREFRRIVEDINKQEASFTGLSDEELKAYTDTLRGELGAGIALDALVPRAFALVREAARRTLGERHYDVQLIGGLALHRGMIAEMRTGEGKTLVATLPAYLNALAGKGVHVVTVNDYLARRDGAWMGQVYHALGLTLGVITQDGSYRYDPAHVAEEEKTDEARDATGSFRVFHEYLRPCSRSEAYAADITYGTNSEFGFDYLRDNTEYDTGKLRQRAHSFAIVDEIDSILIDEARTPLIISAPAQEGEGYYKLFADIAARLEEGKDFTKDEKHRSIALTDEGIEKVEKILNVENLYTEKGVRFVHHLETAVRARALFLRDSHYVIKGNEVIIVDEFTGRMQPGRRWSDGLHQAVEAKEGVSIQRESRTVASITYQNYFRMYEKLAGMTGTASTSAEEFYSVYRLEVLAIPTHRPIARRDFNDLIFINEHGKLTALAKKVKALQEVGQPVLIGTVSIEKNEELSAYLAKQGVVHEVLNAKNHEREGEIIAQAGRKGGVTVATNMAGRGVDIKLGGNPPSREAADAVRELGGLFVIGTERHEARRIDNQLRGRSGRQGDPGATQFYVSLEDSLMRIFGNHATIKRVMEKAVLSEEEPIAHSMITKSLEKAQSQVEGRNFDVRKRVLAYDDVLNKQRKSIYGRRRELLFCDEDALAAYLAPMLAEERTLAEAVSMHRKEGKSAEPIRLACLEAIDSLWLEHLEVMDHLRASVSLRAYGQRDPLLEYRREGLRLFRELESAVVARTLAVLSARLKNNQTDAPPALAPAPGSVARTLAQAQRQGTVARPIKKEEEKIGRNDPVVITDGKETKEMKYKKAQPLLDAGWRLVSSNK